MTAIAYTLFVFLLAVFALPIGERFGGDAFYDRGLFIAGIVSGASLLILLWKKRRQMTALKWMALVFILSIDIAFYFNLEIRLEEIHLINFSVLTILFKKALDHSSHPSLRSMVYAKAIALAVLVGSLDEFLQKFIPGRVSDLRDVGLCGVAALLGAGLAWISS